MKDITFDKLEDLFEKELGQGPFPAAQTRMIARGENYARFHGHLLLFLADIAGIASRGRRLQKISTEDRTRFLEIARAGFFDKYPQYRHIERRITDTSAPDLLKLLKATEQARLLILEGLAG